MSPCHLGHSALNWCSTSLLLALFPTLFLEARPRRNGSTCTSQRHCVDSQWNMKFSIFFSWHFYKRQEASYRRFGGGREKSLACFNEWWVITVGESRGRNCLHVRLCVCAFVCPNGNLATLEWNLEYAQYVGRLILCSSAHLFHPRLLCLPASPPPGPPLVVSRLLCCSCKWSGLMASAQPRVLMLWCWRCCAEIKQVYVVLCVKSC